MIPRSKSTLWAIFAVLAICVPSVYSLAVMSVDLGTEWMKVAVVSVSIIFQHFLNTFNTFKNSIFL